MGRPRRDATPKRDVILEVARELFLGEGYAAVSMDRIAARARASKKTIYACFPSKEHAFLAVADSLAMELRVQLADPETLFGSPHNALSAFGARLLRVLSRPSMVGMHRLWASEGGRFAGFSARFEARVFEPVHRELTHYLRRETERGTLGCSEPRLAAAQFLGLIKEPVFWPYVLGLRSVVFRPRQTVEAACRVFLKAYAPATRSSTAARKSASAAASVAPSRLSHRLMKPSYPEAARRVVRRFAPAVAGFAGEVSR